MWRFQREFQCGGKVDFSELLGNDGIFQGSGNGLIVENLYNVLVLPCSDHIRITKEVDDAGILQDLLNPGIVEKPEH